MAANYDSSGLHMGSGTPVFKRITTPAKWTSHSLVTLFIDLCIDEKEKTRSNGCHWDWNRIGKVLLEEEGVDYDEKQLKRQHATLKTKYEAWRNYDATAPNRGSSAKNGINLKDLQKVRNISEHVEELKLLFGYSAPLILTGGRASCPDYDETEESSQASMGSSQKDTDDDDEADTEKTKDYPSTSSKAPSLSGDKGDKKRSYSSDFNGDLERVLKTIKTSNEETTLEKCNEVLNTMEKLEMHSRFYIAACSIFCEGRAYREQWMILSKKPEEVRLGWIVMVAKRLGFV